MRFKSPPITAIVYLLYFLLTAIFGIIIWTLGKDLQFLPDMYNKIGVLTIIFIPSIFIFISINFFLYIYLGYKNTLSYVIITNFLIALVISLILTSMEISGHIQWNYAFYADPNTFTLTANWLRAALLDPSLIVNDFLITYVLRVFPWVFVSLMITSSIGRTFHEIRAKSIFKAGINSNSLKEIFQLRSLWIILIFILFLIPYGLIYNNFHQINLEYKAPPYSSGDPLIYFFDVDYKDGEHSHIVTLTNGTEIYLPNSDPVLIQVPDFIKFDYNESYQHLVNLWNFPNNSGCLSEFGNQDCLNGNFSTYGK